MKNAKIRKTVLTLLLSAATLSPHNMALATNGDLMEGIGAVSEALGGTGVAAPQDGITAIANNPAGLSLMPQRDHHETTLGLTLFQPRVRAHISTPGGILKGRSRDSLSYIPYLSYAQPVSDNWNVGFGAYGVSGMGVNYRGKHWDLDGNPANGYEGDLYTKFAIMKFAPTVSYRVNENLAVGLAGHLNYSTLNIGQGESEDVSGGFSLGAIQRLGDWRLGLAYTSPQRARFRKVYNFDEFLGDSKSDTLVLEQPAIYSAGVGWEPNSKLLFAFDLKYITWGETEGYGDFDWVNQWVYAFGTQYKLTSDLALRAGYNYARNPVKEHHNWNAMGMRKVQGKNVPEMGYQMLRNISFPAIVEHHVTLGVGYDITDRLSLHLTYAHAFEKKITSSSADDSMRFHSKLSEDSLTLGLTWIF